MKLIGIDRDGTINDDPGYFGKGDDWKSELTLMPGVAEGIHKLNQANIRAIVISNQAGVARGFFTLQRMHDVNKAIDSLLAKSDAKVDGWYCCPYVTTDYAEKKDVLTPNEWVKNNGLRKPETGLLKKAMDDFETEEAIEFFMIGDKATDVEFALNANGIGILIKGNKDEEHKTEKLQVKHPEQVILVNNFLEAIDLILKA